MTTEDLAMSVVYTPGRVGTGVAGHPNAQQSAPLLILPDLKAVLQWRQECVQQIASQCCVHESVAVLLLDRHQGGAEKACTAWSCNPQGNIRAMHRASEPLHVWSVCMRGCCAAVWTFVYTML